MLCHHCYGHVIGRYQFLSLVGTYVRSSSSSDRLHRYHESSDWYIYTASALNTMVNAYRISEPFLLVSLSLSLHLSICSCLYP
jgi:hypothetical protein